MDLPALPACSGDLVDSAEDLAKVARSPIVDRQRLYGGQTSTVTLVTTAQGRAVHKTAKAGTAPEDAAFFADGEELAALVAEAVGASIAGVHRDGPDSVWVQYIDGTPASDDHLDSPEAIRIGLLDTLIGNEDRLGNLLTTADGRLVGYDHGGAWLACETGAGADPYLREPSAPMRYFVTSDHTWSHHPIPSAELAEIRDRLADLRPVFHQRGRDGWLDYTLGILDQIHHHAAPVPPLPPPGPATQPAQHHDAELTVWDVTDADEDMANQIGDGVAEALAAAQGCETLYTGLEAVHAKVVELRVPGALEGWILELMDKTQTVRARALAIAAQLPAASEAIREAGIRAEARHRPLADAVRDAGHVRPAENEYHNG